MAEIKLKVTHEIHLAGHLCGRTCEEILEGNTDFPQLIYDYGFRRIQVNATAANNVNVDMNKKEQIIDNLRKCILKYKSIEWIIQSNQETSFIGNGLSIDPPTNMVLLYDSSCGLGIQISETTIQPPHNSIACGYAGGIGPSTIANTLILLNKIVSPTNKSIWIDMESSLRSYECDSKENAEAGNFKDVFSITKCYECIQICKSLLSLPTA